MRAHTVLRTALTLGACLIQASPVLAQGTTVSDAECQGLRQRLAEHARLSEGVRRAVTAQAGAAPAAPAPTPAASTGRAEAIRARLEQIPKDRQALEEQRLGAMMKFDLSRAGQIQTQIQAIDAEKANLEREQAALPASPSSSSAVTTQVPASDPTARIRCQDMPAAVDNAVKTRRRELGAREDQAGAIPLIGLKGQSADQIGQELAAQFAPGAAATAQVGLLDADGNGQLDGIVDVPAPGIFRLVRQRADGTMSVETFPTATGGTAPAYGEMTRRLDEATARQTGQKLPDVLATRPAAPLRATTQTAEFAQAYAQFQAGNFTDAARLTAPAARSTEFQNLRGQSVRVLEIIGPIAGGVSLRRAVVLAQPNDQELWEETTTMVRPASYWRTDVEVARSRETRTTSGALVGTPSASAPSKFSLER
ncbi:MAG TPA: hypothetical protein VN646_19905 [Candidatus Acidoferrum sp.]|jgi:hypothetical protein|nr:hypothetical protein [Candidatus Acidoferrum sp.]